MSWTPTDEQVEKATIAAHDAHCPDRKCEPQTMGTYRRDARAVLVAVGPMIAAAVWEEAYWRGVDDQITADDANMGYGPNRVNPYRIEKEAGR